VIEIFESNWPNGSRCRRVFLNTLVPPPARPSHCREIGRTVMLGQRDQIIWPERPALMVQSNYETGGFDI